MVSKVHGKQVLYSECGIPIHVMHKRITPFDLGISRKFDGNNKLSTQLGFVLGGGGGGGGGGGATLFHHCA